MVVELCGVPSLELDKIFVAVLAPVVKVNAIVAKGKLSRMEGVRQAETWFRYAHVKTSGEISAEHL